jgi:Domain of unknown function (DUF4124)
MGRSTALLAFATVALLAGQAANADQTVYKWKDSSGNLHYTQQPPVGIASEAISVKQGYSTRDETARDPTPEERAAAERSELCRVATKNYEMLSGAGAVKRRDEYGQDHTLTDEEKAAERDRAKAGMDLNCAPAN